MADSPDRHHLSTLSEFLARLTLGRVLLGLLFAAGSMMLYVLWEQRLQWGSALWQSQSLLTALVVGSVMIAIGAAINSLQHRLDQKTDSLYRQMRDQIEDQSRALDVERKERHIIVSQMTVLTAHVEELTEKEALCQVRVQRLQLELSALIGGSKTGAGPVGGS